MHEEAQHVGALDVVANPVGDPLVAEGNHEHGSGDSTREGTRPSHGPHSRAERRVQHQPSVRHPQVADAYTTVAANERCVTDLSVQISLAAVPVAELVPVVAAVPVVVVAVVMVVMVVMV